MHSSLIEIFLVYHSPASLIPEHSLAKIELKRSEVFRPGKVHSDIPYDDITLQAKDLLETFRQRAGGHLEFGPGGH